MGGFVIVADADAEVVDVYVNAMVMVMASIIETLMTASYYSYQVSARGEFARDQGHDLLHCHKLDFVKYDWR